MISEWSGRLHSVKSLKDLNMPTIKTVFYKKCVHEPPFQCYLSLLGGFLQPLQV